MAGNARPTDALLTLDCGSSKSPNMRALVGHASTLCVDRIYDERLPVEDRQPACVLACPTSARMFGDFDDPQSSVSKASVGRALPAMLSDLGYRPTNQYLAPRAAPQINVAPMTNAKKSLTALLREWVGKSSTN